MENPTEAVVMIARPDVVARYKLTVVIPMLLIIVLVVIGTIIALSTEELFNVE